MILDKKEKKEVVESLNNKFLKYDCISYDYLLNFVEAILDEKVIYDGIILDYTDFKEDTNPRLYILFKISNCIYYKLCKNSLDDADILITLVEEKTRIANMVFRKFKINDFSKCEDYLMEAFNLFDNSESFDSFITRFIMAKIKGIPFETKKVIVKKESENVLETKKKKQKKRKTEDQEIVIEGTKVQKQVNVSVGSSEELEEAEESEIILVVPKLEIKEEPIDSYQKCVELCKDKEPSGKKDSFAQMGRKIGIVGLGNTDSDLLYEMYLLLRFGYIDNKYFGKEEIAKMIDVSLLKVIEFERKTSEFIRDYINKLMDDYGTYVLSKTFS